ncbi:MAG: hypothetical protein ACFFCQ_02435 [Promethearchaeota archaeon]
MDFLSATTISSQVQRLRDGTIRFQRSEMDRFLCILYLSGGTLLMLGIYVFRSFGGLSTFYMLIFGIGLALFFRGAMALLLLPYTIELRPKEGKIIRKISLLGFISRETIIPYSTIQGFEIRQYRRRNMLIKEWEFRFITNTSIQTKSHFLGRTKNPHNAQAIAKIMDQESQLKLIS